MNGWIISILISGVFAIITTTILKRFFEYDNDEIPRLYVLITCLASFVPVGGYLMDICIIVFILSEGGDGRLSLKEKPFKSKWLNNFFLK